MAYYIVKVRNKQGELLHKSGRMAEYDDARAVANAYMQDQRYPDAKTALIYDADTGVYCGSITIIEDKV